MSQDCTTTEQEVLARLRALYDAYSKQDLDEIISFFAPDSDVVVIGTAEDERVVGIDNIRESWKRSLDEPVHLHIKITWHSLTCRENVAWFSVELHYAVQLDEESTLNLSTRGTGVMEKRDGTWLLCQYHSSHPTPALPSRYKFFPQADDTCLASEEKS